MDVLGVIPIEQRDLTILITQQKFKALLLEQRGRYNFLTPEFVNDFCSRMVWIADPVENNPRLVEVFLHINLQYYYDQNRQFYQRLVTFLNELKEKRAFPGYKYFLIGRNYPEAKFFMMRVNLIAFHFLDLRFDRLIDPRP